MVITILTNLPWMLRIRGQENPASFSAIMNKAFSLVEVLVTIAVVGFALVAIVEMFVVVSRGSESAENLSTATNLAQERVEEIRHLVQKGVSISIGAGSSSGTFLPSLSNVSIDSYLNDNFYLTESNDCSGAGPSLSEMTPPRRVDRITQVEWTDGEDTYKKVQVTVFWQEKGKTLSTGLVSCVRE